MMQPSENNLRIFKIIIDIYDTSRKSHAQWVIIGNLWHGSFDREPFGISDDLHVAAMNDYMDQSLLLLIHQSHKKHRSPLLQ